VSGKGDVVRQEFERFVADRGDGLLRTAYLLVWDMPAAEDLVQECLTKLARRWPRVRAMAYPAAYARRILVNLALDSAKRRARQRAELDQKAQSSLERHDDHAAAQLRGIETQFVLGRALGALPPRQRATLVLRYFDDLSETETAKVMGCSVGTVKSTTSRALDRLRVVLAPAPGEARDNTVSSLGPAPLVAPHGLPPRSEFS
jgi:RNA polymerase sigma-70 factor (sigma-E family)